MSRVADVHRSARHSIAKPAVERIQLCAGLGVEGDAHFGATVRHRYDRRRDPARPNARQVHLIAAELYASLASDGFALAHGDLGENVTTSGIDLMRLPLGTRLRLGADAIVELTGLREPCALLDRVRPGVRVATSTRIGAETALRDAVMAVVLADGVVRAGDVVAVTLPDGPHRPMRLV